MPQSPRTPWVFLIPVAVVPAALAVFQLGRLHPDEVFQSLEPALNRAFGFGVLAWEWQVGLRNWAVPLLFAGLLKLSAALGINDPQARRAVLELPQLALHAAMLLAVYRLAARRVPEALARWAIPLLGLYGLVLHFGGRTVGEAWSAALLVWGLERLDDRDARAPQHALGGLLLGLSVVARYGSAVFVAAAMLTLLAQRRWKSFGLAAAGGLSMLAFLAVLDWQTWGDPLHSFIAYTKFNVLSGQAAAQFGVQPAWFYLPHLGWVALWAWPGFFFGRAKLPWLLVVPALAYVIAVSITPHKEERFLYPALVLLVAGGIPGWLMLLSKLSDPRAQQVAALSVLASVTVFFIPSPFAPQRPEQFRLVLKAGREATGLIVMNEGMWGSPGYFWLGKNIPWFPCDFPEDGRFQQAVRTPGFNRAVTWDDRGLAELQQFGFQVLETQGQAKLLGR